MFKKICIVIVLTLIETIAFAVDPNCPRCHGSGRYREGGTAYTHVYTSCRNCGETYDAFDVHFCECQYCVDYIPQSSGSDASWEDDIGYQAAMEYAQQKHSYKEQNEYSANEQDTYAKTETKTFPAREKKADSGIPTWVIIIGGAALGILVAYLRK